MLPDFTTDTFEKQKMTSLETTALSQVNSGSSEEAQEFVILSNPPSLGGSLDPGALSMSNFNMAVVSAVPDLNPDECERWLKELLAQNMALKDALDKALSMVRVCIGYQENQLSKLEESEKPDQKLSTADESSIDSQAKESHQSTGSLDHSCPRCAILEKKVLAFQREINAGEHTKKTLACEVERLQSLQLMLEQNIGTISLDLGNLQINNKALEAEKRELTALNNQLVTQLSNLSLRQKGTQTSTSIFSDDESGYAIVLHPDEPTTANAWDNDCLKGALLELQAEQIKVGELTQQLAEERTQVACLKEMLEDKICEGSMASSQSSTKNPVDKCFHDANSYALPQEMEHSCHHVPVSKFLEHENKCINIEEYEDKLQQIKDLQCTINQQRLELEGTQRILQERELIFQEHIKHLEGERKNLEQMKSFRANVENLKDHHNGQKAKDSELDSEQQNVKRLHMEELDCLTAKLINAEQQLENKEHLITSLRKDIALIKEELETIPILRAQVEFYKSDVENGKMACESAGKEVEKLSEKVKHLQKSSMKDHYFKDKGTSKHKYLHRYQNVPQPKSQPGFECPCCKKTYMILSDLEKHVELCMLKHTSCD